MKTSTFFRLIFAILLVCISMQVFPQTAPTDYYSRLFYLCKAWGHAKYYHTQIAKGPATVNWDEKLLTAITEVKNAPTVDNTAFNAAVLKMLISAGTMKTSKAALPVVPDDLNLNKDLSWMDAPIFSDAVRLNLKNIWQKFRPQSNYYVEQAFIDGNPTFDMDNLYNSEMDISASEGKRLLGLFRYWNIINYFFPYKKLMDQTWDATLAEYIPQVALENAGSLYLLGMFNRLNDAHSGDQTWMAENLAFLPEVSPDSSTSFVDKHYYVYGYNGTDVRAAKNIENYRKFGVLYNWPAAMNGASGSNSVPSGVQGACPSGWHLPSDTEWMVLEKTLGMSDAELKIEATRYSGNVGDKLKSTVGWDDDNLLIGQSGFNALPGGVIIQSASRGLNQTAYFWTSTALNDYNSWNRIISLYGPRGIFRNPRVVSILGHSIRCVKD